MQQDTIKYKVKILSLVLAIFIFIIGGLIVLSHSQFVLSKLNQWKLLPRPERFTELYFASYPQDVSQVPDGMKVSFSFTVTNREGATTTYPYAVYLLQAMGTTIIGTGTITLSNDASTTVAETHTLRRAWEAGQFEVVLPTMGEHIDFYVPTTTSQ